MKYFETQKLNMLRIMENMPCFLEKTDNDIPIITSDEFEITDVIGFNHCNSSKLYSKTIHCFLEDYQFDRLLNYPSKYSNTLSLFNGMLSPDFSLFVGMPKPQILWQIFKSRYCAALLNLLGINIKPVVSWTDSNYELCFEGIKIGSEIAISNIGLMQNKKATSLFYNGLEKAIEIINPKKIYIYGKEYEKIDFPNIQYLDSFLKQLKGRCNGR